MKKILFPVILVTVGAAVLTGCIAAYGSSGQFVKQSDFPKSKESYKIVYFAPEIAPDVDEIKPPSYQAFFDSVTNKLSPFDQIKIDRLQTVMEYDMVDTQTIQEICKNNTANLVVVPKIQYFKVGLGKYVFSNQVVVSMKLYNAEGELIKEASYDTFKRNKRLLRSTENSIKIGTNGVMNDLLKTIKKTQLSS